jgi:hypothetical protein
MAPNTKVNEMKYKIKKNNTTFNIKTLIYGNKSIMNTDFIANYMYRSERRD